MGLPTATGHLDGWGVILEVPNLTDKEIDLKV